LELHKQQHELRWWSIPSYCSTQQTVSSAVINTGASLSLMFSIDGHEFQIIEADGNDVNTSFNEQQAAQALAVAQ
jgi:FtsP/CotA-like multicopper oxidase with cupredoxin domain